MPEKMICQYHLRKPADETQKIRAVRDFVSARKEEYGLIFCAAPTRAESVCSYLKKSGFAAACILPDEDAEEKQRVCMKEDVHILVAVTGTGLLVSRTDVRYVLHYNMPLSLQDYLQETAYAGRDGRGGSCVLFYMAKDRKLLENRLKKILLNSRTDGEQENLKRKKEAYAELLRLCGMPAAEAERILQREAEKRSETAAEKTTGQKSPAKQKHRRNRAAGSGQKQSRRRADPEALCVCMTPEAERIRRGEDPDITYFDLMTADAVCTLMKQGMQKIYAKGIMEVLSGNSALTLRPEKKAGIETILRKLTARGFLFLKEEKSGFVCDLSEMPGYYTEAENRQKTGLIPAEALCVRGVPTSEENLALTHYLYMHGPGGADKKNTILLTHMWKALGIEFPAGAYYKKRKEQTILKKTERILEHFRDKKHIRDFAISAKQIQITG